MASTKVEVRDNRELRRVEALDKDGEVAGWAEYQIGLDGSTFDFTHTEVDERFEGQGIGTQLAAGIMELLRSENARIIPTCSFLRHYMDKNEDTQDLRAEPEPDEDEGQEDQDGAESGDAAPQEPDDSHDGSHDGSNDGSNDEEDSPQAGPADAKAAGSGGAAEETEDEPATTAGS
jgi:predicted GNAT family acetyltransferase